MNQMDHRKLIVVVAQCPPLWDRSHDKFRDQGFKANLWNKIGLELNTTGPACREAFKALREKYIREREKLQYGVTYKKWELLDYLQFLDPYIITRKQSQNYNQPMNDEYIAMLKQDHSQESDLKLENDTDINGYIPGEKSTTDFCKDLIKLVYESKVLWDRHCKEYHNKSLKESLWNTIAQTLKTDVNMCTLRWKGLREKYIRQKQKHTEGISKWEFLHDLSFLDSVIQYRKKHQQIDEANNTFAANDSSCAISQANSEYDLTDEQSNDSIPNRSSSWTNTYPQSISSNSTFNIDNLKNSIPDSSSTSDSGVGLNVRKRTLSEASDLSYLKKSRNDSQYRTPEQIFGELVAAMLAVKPEKEKNVIMMEIMSILAKPS